MTSENCRISSCFYFCASIAVIFLEYGCSHTRVNHYPDSAFVPYSEVVNGQNINDPFRWLEDGTDPKVRAWTEKQNDYTLSIIEKLPRKDQIFQRLNELSRYNFDTSPQRVRQGDRVFFYRKTRDTEKWIYMTRPSLAADPKSAIDPNLWSKEISLDSALPSWDGNLIAFSSSSGGSENSVLKIIETDSGKEMPDTFAGWRQIALAWLPDSSGLFYGAYPAPGTVPPGEENYWFGVFYHPIGSIDQNDTKIFHDAVDKEVICTISISENGNHILFSKYKMDKSELYLSSLSDWTKLTPIVTGFKFGYHAQIYNNTLFIETTECGSRNCVFTAPVENPSKENWSVFLPETEDNLVSFDGIGGRFYAQYLHQAHSIVKIYSFEGVFIREMRFPTMVSVHLAGRFHQDDVWVNLSSFGYPDSIFSYHFDEDELVLYSRIDIDVDLDSIETEQVIYPSKDGTLISMFLVHRKNIQRNSENPVYLYGYGGFNYLMTPFFSSSTVVLLEAGCIVAYPNLRGGGEYGESWHEAGMKQNKQNVFDDMIAAAQWLVDNQYSRPSKIAVSGGSNGGLLAGAVLVQRPDLFEVIHADVPLLDMIRYHKFGYASIWRDEYGDPDNPQDFEYLYAYSPYHNVIAGVDYPAVLITTGANDSRVDPLHSRKMIAKLQHTNPSGRPALLLLRPDSGHLGAAELTSNLEFESEILAFILDRLNVR